MNYETALLVFGILLLLIGLVGQVKAKELEIGTSSTVARAVIGVVGVALIILSLTASDQILTRLTSIGTSPESEQGIGDSAESVGGIGDVDLQEESILQEEAAARQAELEEELRKQQEEAAEYTTSGKDVS